MSARSTVETGTSGVEEADADEEVVETVVLALEVVEPELELEPEVTLLLVFVTDPEEPKPEAAEVVLLRAESEFSEQLTSNRRRQIVPRG